jgi:hypothetical protein
MKQYSALNWLVAIVTMCALAAAGSGLFMPSGGSSIAFRTIREETVEIWGQGLYKYDTPIGATGFTAADMITLVLAIPVLLISIIMYRRGSLKGGLLLTVCSRISFTTIPPWDLARLITTCSLLISSSSLPASMD